MPSGWLTSSCIFSFTVGNHGYDNALAEMHPIFLAHGPAFRKNFTKEAMNSTDLYPLLCHLLNITALPHNGSFRNVRDLLSSAAPKVTPYTQSTTHKSGKYGPEESYPYYIGTCLGSIIVVVFLVVLVKHLIQSQVPTLQYMQVEVAQPLLQA